IWTSPPEKETGYLEPRDYELSIGMELQGTSSATGIRGTTVTPVKLPEQKVLDFKIETEGCQAMLRPISNEAAQLFIAAPGIAAGQIIRAVARYKLTICKEFHNYQEAQFPTQQKVPRDFTKVYLNDSPGIQTRDKTVKALATSLAQSGAHPWQQAKLFHQWVWENIKGRPGAYTNVLVALRDKQGDCEERAAVFVALCRASGIPARIVWVPNHNWAEFWLHDEQGQGHWIPAHTSAYSWFGYTGAHELVLQKGDNLQVPEERKGQRLLADWMQWQGGRPKVRYIAELQPIASETQTDPGPGARSKDARGEWVLLNKHPDDKYMRKG
ncbi:MAG TPA: transglutaminase-like domain-containing protein, partial [Pirellulaceae bacterium]|nr:transglutaminase-like domain-containing protein [Pirellulaceae bacterium]